MANFKIIIPSATTSNVMACVQSILEKEPHLKPEDIIVIDDGARTDKLNVHWVEGIKPFVFARNVNLGIQAANTNVILMNDDTRLMTPRGFSKLAEVALSRPEFGIVSSALTPSITTRDWQAVKPGNGIREVSKTISFVCVFISKAVQDSLGLLDERFVEYGYDDDDYCHRALYAGYKVGVYDGCVIEHDKIPSTYRSKPFQEKMEHNRKLFEKKWTTPGIHLNPGVTLVITSCSRPELLKRTLESFLKFNTYLIAKTIIIEDGPENRPDLEVPNLCYLSNGERRGQLYSIDRAYAQVDTEYIFHCEDDWEFFRSGFIEESIPLLENYPKVLSVWIRDDFPTTCNIDTKRLGIPIVDPDRNGCPTLSWNPGLRRTADYLKLGGSYTKVIQAHMDEYAHIKGSDWYELCLSRFYKKLGFVSAKMPGAVRHIGGGQHLEEIPIVKRSKPVMGPLKPGITLVITSCGRPDLLARTVKSFNAMNAYPIARTILIEDGLGVEPKLDLPNLCYLTNGLRKGQLYSIDRAYAEVDTEYIFHCEDDWEFLKPGFIEASMGIMSAHSKIVNVWLREQETNTILLPQRDLAGLKIVNQDPRINKCPTSCWNPGLFRTSDYVGIGADFTARILPKLGKSLNLYGEAEKEVSLLYKSLGYYAAVLQGFVRHIGDGRHVNIPSPQSTQVTPAQLPRARRRRVWLANGKLAQHPDEMGTRPRI